MARYTEPTAQQTAAWTKWVNERSPVIRDIALRFDPWSLYRLKSSNQRVTLHSISEDGTVTVNVLAKFNMVLFERQVFGVNPDNLEPSELPDPDEQIGALMTEQEVEANLDSLRVLGRPDLWVMDADGKAVRRH